ncbi:hypothetical protein AVEN_127684-1, partial [Araneus ventricosus]
MLPGMRRTQPAGSHLVRSKSPNIMDGSPDPTIRFVWPIVSTHRVRRQWPIETERFVKPPHRC